MTSRDPANGREWDPRRDEVILPFGPRSTLQRSTLGTASLVPRTCATYAPARLPLARGHPHRCTIALMSRSPALTFHIYPRPAQSFHIYPQDVATPLLERSTSSHVAQHPNAASSNPHKSSCSTSAQSSIASPSSAAADLTIAGGASRQSFFTAAKAATCDAESRTVHESKPERRIVCEE